MFSDTLHTPLQLSADRPMLGGAIRKLLKDSAIVVIGYGGWDDVFMRALAEAIRSDDIEIELIWGFYSNNEEEIMNYNQGLLERMNDGITLGRVSLFAGITAEKTLPAMAKQVVERKSAESIRVFLDRMRNARTFTSAYYPRTLKPWHEVHGSLGDYAKLIETIEPQLSTKMALYTAQFLLPRLEGQRIHQAPKIRKWKWVREAVEDSIALIENREAVHDKEWLTIATYQIKLESFEVRTEDDFDSHALDVAGNAVCSALAALSKDGEFEVPNTDRPGRLPADVWAAKCVNTAARTLFDDDTALLGYLSERIISGRDPYQRFSR